MIDAEYLKSHYGRLADHELLRLSRGDLVPEARVLLLAEMDARGIAAAASEGPGDDGGAVGSNGRVTAPYSPPSSRLADPQDHVEITFAYLVELFRGMVVVATIIGAFLYWWHLLPLPMSEDMRMFKAQSGAGALAPVLSQIMSLAVQPLWLLSAVGLWCFRWWGRALFLGLYGVGAVLNLVGGATVSLPWENVLITVVMLLDGAILALAFLPPLARRFSDNGA
jgi:hypothetical protein